MRALGFDLQTGTTLRVLTSDVVPSCAMIFSNGASLLRLVSAVLSKISDDRETERVYLPWKPSGPPAKNMSSRKVGASSVILPQ